MMTMTVTPFTSGPAAKTWPTYVCGELDPQRRGPTLRGCPAHTVLHVKNSPATHPEGGEGNSLKVTKIY